MLCGKRIFVSRQQAMEAIKGFNGQHTDKTKHSYKSYFCISCDAWHVASQGKKFKNIKAKPVEEMKTVIGKYQGPLIIHEARKFKVK